MVTNDWEREIEEKDDCLMVVVVVDVLILMGMMLFAKLMLSTVNDVASRDPAVSERREQPSVCTLDEWRNRAVPDDVMVMDERRTLLEEVMKEEILFWALPVKGESVI